MPSRRTRALSKRRPRRSLPSSPATWSSHELTNPRADVLIAVPSLVPSIAALVTFVDIDHITAGRQVHKAPSLLQSPRQLMLLSSSHVLLLLLYCSRSTLLQP